jgi:hypothetical protein
MLALTLQCADAEDCQIAELQNVRTEIVLKDGRDVAFWFSFIVRFAIVRQQRNGKRSPQVVHQTRTSTIKLFPKQRANRENIKFREDEASTN